jgi:hypothetical protein
MCTLAACASTSSDPIALSNSNGKADGSTGARVHLSKDSTQSFTFACDEWISCDVTLSANPSDATADAIVYGEAHKSISDFPQGIVNFWVTRDDGTNYDRWSGFQTQDPPGGTQWTIGLADGNDVFYQADSSLPSQPHAAKFFFDASVASDAPVDEGDFVITASWQ